MGNQLRSQCPDSKRPYLIYRLSSPNVQKEYWGLLLEQFKQYKNAFDEVWFSTGTGVPSLEKHRELSHLAAECAEDIRKLGWQPGLQIQATLGHSDAGTATTEGKNWGGYVGRNGEVCQKINCPRQPGFLNYLREMSKIYAQWHPSSVWLDDDLRPNGHYPAIEPYGCYCPDCLAAFSGEQGKNYTRSELIERCDRDAGFMKEWIDFTNRSICGVAEVIVEEFKKISPETRFGLQHNNMPSRFVIFDALKKVSGTRAGSRPSGGAYSDHEPYTLIDSATLMSRQVFEQQRYETLGQICAEIESFPRAFCCKTPQGYRIESLLYSSLGVDSLSLYMAGPDIESPQWYGKNLIAPYAAEADSYRDFLRHTEGTLIAGLGLPAGNAPHQTIRSLGIPLVGVPFSSFSPDSLCFMLTARAAEALTDDDLRDVLKKNIWLDGEALKIIEKRGFSDLTGHISAEKITVPVLDNATDDPMNNDLSSGKHFPFGSEKPFRLIVPELKDLRVISRYQHPDGTDAGISTLLWQRPDGSRVAISANNGFNTYFVSSSHVLQLNRIADWLSDSRMPVLALDPVQSLIIPRTSPDGTAKAVTVLNTTISTQPEFELELRNLNVSNCTLFWCVPAAEPIELQPRQCGSHIRVTIPEISAWGIGWLKVCDLK